MRRWILATLIVATSLSAGCSDRHQEDTGDSVGSTGSTDDDSPARGLGGELCRLAFDVCSCPEQVFASQAQCTAAYAAQLEAEFAKAEADGLVYDPKCMDELVGFFRDTVGCKSRSELGAEIIQRLNSSPTCKVYAGVAGLGEACTPHYSVYGDSCVQGLQCLGSTCVESPAPAKNSGEACGPAELCEAGHACLAPADAPAGPLTCRRLPALGEVCIDGLGCDIGLVCKTSEGQFEGVCAPPPTGGEPCGEFPLQCAEGFYCGDSEHLCTPTLADGAPCQDDEAGGAGFVCDEATGSSDDVCQPEEPVVCI